jgi:hypothetical protein
MIRTARLPAALASALALVVLAVGTGTATAATFGFGQRQYVDPELAGGEPFVLADNVHKTLIYTAHEGTTHLYQPGVAYPFDFLGNYRNQVNIWYSDDNGTNWKRLNLLDYPPTYTGFSDPDLTQDTGGRVYNTGIDLVNDALFSSADGGKRWDKGTPNCYGGDRPWLAGARPEEVFLATNTNEDGHQVFRSTDGGNTCSATGVPDDGNVGDWSYTGNGKLLYDAVNDQLVEPITFQSDDGIALGVSTWHRGDPEFTPGAMIPTTMLAHWPAIAIDRGGTTYMVWDTDPRKDDGKGCGDTLLGNGNSGSPLPNEIKLAWSRDYGKTWSTPITIASGSANRVFWPWIAAGDPGKVAVTWYASDRLADLDCEQSTVSIYSAHVSNATGKKSSVQTAEVSHGPIHVSSTVCQGGTTCVATGQDRRLGDFFTNALDPRGCELIASGDTTRPDPVTGGPRPTALPILIRQNSGPALVGKGSC